MILIESKWNKDLLNLNYGDGYDIRVHAVQVALNLIYRRSKITGPKMKKLDFAYLRFGYYSVETEFAITEFQNAVGIPASGQIDEVTYTSLFAVIRSELNSVIVETSEGKLRVCEITKELEEELPGVQGDNMDSDGSQGNSGLYGDSYDDYTDYDKESDNYTSSQNNVSSQSNNQDKFFDSLDNGTEDVMHIYTPNFGSGGTSNQLTRQEYTDINGGRTLSPDGNASSDFIDGLLSNSIYKGNFDYERPVNWVSNSKMNVNVDGYVYDTSEKYNTFFGSGNTSATRKSGYDITIVYGSNGQFAKKILEVIPRNRSQQIDPSGEAIYDVIEFVAKDIVETDNMRIK